MQCIKLCRRTFYPHKEMAYRRMKRAGNKSLCAVWAQFCLKPFVIHVATENIATKMMTIFICGVRQNFLLPSLFTVPVVSWSFYSHWHSRYSLLRQDLCTYSSLECSILFHLWVNPYSLYLRRHINSWGEAFPDRLVRSLLLPVGLPCTFTDNSL